MGTTSDASATRTLRGVVPVAPTIFHDDESLDLAGQARTIEFIVDSGADAVCVLGNFSEQFLLTDDERRSVMRVTLDTVADRIPVCVTTSHFSARIASARCRDAQDHGASAVMMMPPFFGATITADETGVDEYFRRVCDGLDADVMIQDSPLSPTPISAALLSRLAREVDRIRYAKIEVPRAADKIRTLMADAGGSPLAVLDGEEGVTLIPDLEAGAVGTISSALAPDLLTTVVNAFTGGDHEAAEQGWMHLLPLLQFENRQAGLVATKSALRAGGVIQSDRVRSPLTPLSPEKKSKLETLLRERDALVLRWAR